MRSLTILLGAVAASTLTMAGSAYAGTADLLYVDQTYTSTDQSLILQQAGSQNFFLENFEDGALNSPWLSASTGSVYGPAFNTDSVDTDDGGLPDGSGLDGHSWFMHGTMSQNVSVTFSFTPNDDGALPSWVGAVWTDGVSGPITIEAFDADGLSLGAQTIDVTNDPTPGATGEDRFIGMAWAAGISAFTISNLAGSMELDHVQYAYAASVIPLPAPLAMGLMGLMAVGFNRRRRQAVEN